MDTSDVVAVDKLGPHIYKVLHHWVHTGPFLETFLGWVFNLCVPTKMGVVGDIWAWSIKFRVLYTLKIWRDGKA